MALAPNPAPAGFQWTLLVTITLIRQ